MIEWFALGATFLAFLVERRDHSKTREEKEAFKKALYAENEQR